MPLPDPALLPPIPVIRETKIITDPSASGTEWPFTFEVQEGFPAMMLLEDLTNPLIERFVHQKETIPGPSGARIKVSEKLCKQLALLMSMDVTGAALEPPVPNWQVAHWVAFAYRCPNAFVDVLTWAYELQAKGINAVEEGDAESGTISLKNESAAGGEGSFAPPQGTTDIPIS